MNDCINKNAYMNWRIEKNNPIDNMINIANGYKNSTIKLIKSLIEDNWNKDADIEIFPIFFMMNHSIELYLKSIMWSINVLTNKGEKFKGKHNILQIYNMTKPMVEDYEKSINRNDNIVFFRENTKVLYSYLKDIDIKIKKNSNGKKDNIDFSRYPINSAKENHFYVDEIDNVVIDLENLLYVSNDILENLESIATYYTYEIDQKIQDESLLGWF
ncbi:hypothetical protein LFJ61_001414 [Clostridium perfringens]|nr:hypothetical protein [Clostridium perfringens]